MVRNIAGVLIAVGAGKQDETWVIDVLKAKNREAAGITATPDGLYLIDIKYPKHYSIPKAKSIIDKLM